MELVRIEIADGTVKTAPWTDRDENGFPNIRHGDVVGKSEHATVYRLSDGQGIYAICVAGFESEGRKELVECVVSSHREEMARRMKRIEELERMLEESEKASEPSSLVRVRMEWNPNEGLKTYEEVVSAEDKGNYKDIEVHKGDGFMDDMFFGHCWKRNERECRRRLYTAVLEWLSETRGKKTEAIQTATAQIQRIDEISEQCKKELEKI